MSTIQMIYRFKKLCGEIFFDKGRFLSLVFHLLVTYPRLHKTVV